MEAAIVVAVGAAGVLAALVVVGVGMWLIRTTLSLLRKLVVFSLVLALGLGAVAVTVAAALMAAH